MKSLIIVASLAILLSSCKKAQIERTAMESEIQPGWTDSSARHPKNAMFNTLLDKYRRKGFPGISLLVRDANGTWIGATGKADITTGKNFKPGTISKAASITKLMVGTMVFRLMEDSVDTGIGFRDLDRRLITLIPEMSRIANGDQVTLGQCMNHQSGIPDLINEDAFYLAVLNNPNKKWTAPELLKFVYDVPALFSAGDSAVYTNTNFLLVAMAIEKLTGQSHASLLKTNILTPLGMANTFYQPHDPLPNSVAQGYFDLYNNNSIVEVSNLVTGSGNGYGGIYSNIFDLYRFMDALFIRRSFLLPGSLQRMLTYGKQDGSNYYGYALQKSFHDRGIDYGIGHKGRDLGYTANAFYFPNKGVLHIFFINYGTDAESNLRETFYQFQEELVTLTLQ
jgi:D-alanyl-D-alanine carboxypeptidase